MCSDIKRYDFNCYFNNTFLVGTDHSIFDNSQLLNVVDYLCVLTIFLKINYMESSFQTQS